jgi:AcrR family transcriptional regulator
MPVVEFDGDRATGIQHFVFIDQQTTPCASPGISDEYVRTAAGWRIRRARPRSCASKRRLRLGTAARSAGRARGEDAHRLIRSPYPLDARAHFLLASQSNPSPESRVPVATARPPARPSGLGRRSCGRRALVSHVAASRRPAPRRRRRSGVKRAALFYHFRDKQLLYDAVIEDAFGALIACLDEAFSVPRRSPSAIERAVEAWVDAIVRAPRSPGDPAPCGRGGRAPAQPLFPAAERLLRTGWSALRTRPPERRARADPRRPVPHGERAGCATVFYVSAFGALLPPGVFRLARAGAGGSPQARRPCASAASSSAFANTRERCDRDRFRRPGRGRHRSRSRAWPPLREEVARRGGADVVNDLGSTIAWRGLGLQRCRQVVEEIERAGGVAVASHDSVACPEGGESIVRARSRQVRLVSMPSSATLGSSRPRNSRSWPTRTGCAC